MPLFSSTAGISARALGLTSGILSGAAAITSILGNQNGTTGTQLLVYFNAGTPGSSPVTDYQYSLNGGSTWNTFASPQTSSPLTITGLTNGTTYSVAIRPMQGLQPSLASNVASGRPVALPSTPSITSITNDANGTTGTHISVAFSGGTGGTDSTTTFQVSTDNGSTWANRTTGTTASPILVTGLTNGTSYNVRIRAVTSIGDTSAASIASVGRPVALPGAPTITGITASTGQLSVAFGVGQAGTDAPATYEYSLDGGLTYFGRQTGTTASPIVITGVDDALVANANKGSGATYSVQIRSVTALNHRSAASATVVPSAILPSAPSNLVATPTPTSLSVAFTSAATGSFAIANHEYSINNGSNWATYASGQSIGSLLPSTQYTVLIRAVDVQGLNGSFASVTATTSAEDAPNAPAITSVTSSSTTSLTVAYTEATQGTYPVGGHEYSINDGATWTPAGASPFTIPELTTDASYSVRLRAFSSYVPDGGTALRGAHTTGSGRVNPGVPTTPVIAFNGMTTSSYSTVKLRVTRQQYDTQCIIYLTKQGGVTDDAYRSDTSRSGATWSSDATYWYLEITGQTSDSKYKYRAKLENRLGGASNQSGFSSYKYWTTPKKNQPYTSAFSTTERYMVRTDISVPAPCSNFYGITYGTIPSSSEVPGYIVVQGISIDIKEGNTASPDSSEGGFTRVMRFNWPGSVGVDASANPVSGITAYLADNVTSSYVTKSKTGLNIGGSNLSNKTIKFEMLNLGATFNSSCVPVQYNGNGAFMWVRSFKTTGIQTTAGDITTAW